MLVSIICWPLLFSFLFLFSFSFSFHFLKGSCIFRPWSIEYFDGGRWATSRGVLYLQFFFGLFGMIVWRSGLAFSTLLAGVRPRDAGLE